jgi:hypothetical protein
MKKHILPLLFLALFANALAFGQAFPGAGNAFDFAGGRAILPPTAGLQPSTTFTEITFEAWVYWRGTTNSGILEGRSDAIHFEITSAGGNLRLRIDEDQVTVNGAVPVNQWVHLAFTANVTEGRMSIYRNGQLLVSRNEPLGSPNFSNYFRIGTSCCGDVSVPNDTRPFNGLIDEVRMWYIEKPQAEIQANLMTKPQEGADGLVLYYSFDEIVNNQAPDLSGNGNHANLRGGLNASNVVTSGAPVGNGGNSNFPANWNSPISEGIFTIRNVSGNPDGYSLYVVEDRPNSTTGIDNLPDEIEEYYGIIFFGGSNVEYDLEIDYSGLIPESRSEPNRNSRNGLDENTIRVYTRGSNQDNNWSLIADEDDLDTDSKTVTVSVNSQQSEFIFSGEPSTLPVELVSFSASLNEKGVLLNWTTASETNNHGFEVLSSETGERFSPVGWVDGKGTTSFANHYQFLDASMGSTETFYQLKQVDFDGKETIYGPIRVRVEPIFGANKPKAYPNPSSSGLFRIDNVEPETNFIQVLNVTGKVVYEKIYGEKLNQNFINLNIADLPSGLYFLRLNSPNHQGQSIVKLIRK